MSDMIKNYNLRTSQQWREISAVFPELGFECGISKGKSQVIRRDDDNEGLVVSWMIQGELKCESPEGDYHIFESCVSIRRPGHKYTFTFYEEKEHLRYYLRVPERIYDFLIQIYPTLDIIPPVSLFSYRVDLRQRFQTLLDRMLRISKPRIIELIPEMAALIIDLTGINIEEEEPPMSKARRLIEQINGLDNLKDIALACGLSYSNFRKKFTETYGISPGQFRIQYRIRESKKILAGGYSVKETAYHLSYPDPFAFAKQFKNITGISPGKYQRKYNKE